MTTRPFTQASVTDEVADLAKRAIAAGTEAMGMTVSALVEAAQILAEAHDESLRPKETRRCGSKSKRRKSRR